MEWVTLVIAVIGLGLSIYNAYVQKVKDQRRLKVIIENVEWVETWRLVIVNTGVRPVTVMLLSAAILDKYETKKLFWKRTKWMPEPIFSSITDSSAQDIFKEFPKTLKDGEYLEIPLSDTMCNALYSKDQRAKFHVFDAEGNEYESKEYRVLNAKYNYYAKMEEPR